MIFNKKFSWYKIADSIAEIDFAPNNLTLLNVAGKTITLALCNDKIFACQHKCPHAGGILAQGQMDAAGNIVCPIHRYKFNLQTGHNVSGEGYYLKHYEVEQREDGWYVKLG